MKRKFEGDDESTLKFLETTVNEMFNQKSAEPFRVPVDPVALMIPDYFEIIKHPKDIGTIKDDLEKKVYTNPNDVLDDIILVFNNCYVYNHPRQYVSVQGQNLQSFFIRKLEHAPSGMFTQEQIMKCKEPHPNRIQQDATPASAKNSSSRKAHSAATTTTSNIPSTNSTFPNETKRQSTTKAVRTPTQKPNVEEILIRFEGDNIPLTDDDKQRMFDIIHILPQKFLEKVIELLQRAAPDAGKDVDTDVKEFDLDSIDVLVQRHLLRYLESCQSVLEKEKSKVKKTSSSNLESSETVGTFGNYEGSEKSDSK